MPQVTDIEQATAPGAAQVEGLSKRRTYVSLPAIVEGVRFIRSHPIILSTMVLDFFAVAGDRPILSAG